MGNLVQRLATLAHKNGIKIDAGTSVTIYSDEYDELMGNYQFSKAFDLAWGKIQNINKRIDEEKPWSLAKEGEIAKLYTCMCGLIRDLLQANYELMPFLPDTAEKIINIFTADVIEPPETPLFPKG